MIFFDEEYKNEKCYWGLQPSPLVVRILEYKKAIRETMSRNI